VECVNRIAAFTITKLIPSLFIFFEIATCYIAQASLELMILLPQPPKCWDYPATMPSLQN
jgi:hypothetical protein